MIGRPYKTPYRFGVESNYDKRKRRLRRYRFLAKTVSNTIITITIITAITGTIAILMGY